MAHPQDPQPPAQPPHTPPAADRVDAARPTVLYDGGCHLCSREIAHYRSTAAAARLDYVDIAAADFNAVAWGVDTAAVNRHLHVRLPDGTWRVGVDAFIAIWQQLPRYGWVARLAMLPGVYGAMRLGYAVFARVRPLLPRRAAAASCRLPD